MHGRGSLHPIFRLVCKRLTPLLVLTDGQARGRGKTKTAIGVFAACGLGILVLIFSPRTSHAAPEGGVVVSGNATVTQTGNAGQRTTTVTQLSDKLSLGWQSFNVGQAEAVSFVQPSTSSLAVNRIYDNHGSQILGRIQANGQVWLLNPNGVLFGKDAQINVAGLLASTLGSTDALGQARQGFDGISAASVSNLGQINTTQGGYVALIGHQVSNQGYIYSPGGTVALGGGNTVNLSFNGNRLLGIQVTQSQLNALAQNGGLIQADGGQVLMSAGARESLLASVVNNNGVIEARTVQAGVGSIVLLGGMAGGTTAVGGTLDASAPNGGAGGFVETSAHTVNVVGGARITTASPRGKQGQWLIDPADFTIAASGGNITGSALGTALNAGDVRIQTSASGTGGGIFVNESVSWESSKTLTLDAWGNIFINVPINAGVGGQVAFKYGQGEQYGQSSSYYIRAPINLSTGNNFTTKRGYDGPTVLWTVITELGSQNSRSGIDLQGIKGHLTGNYVLGADINAEGTAQWDGGFSPIGDGGQAFSGRFDGLGHTVTNLVINRPATDLVGLFGLVGGGRAYIGNVGLRGGSVSGANAVGGLVGYNNAGLIEHSFSSLAVTGSSDVGGLVGKNVDGNISASYATGNVSGRLDRVGGLVGHNLGAAFVDGSYASGLVAGDNDVGGLVGYNQKAPASMPTLSSSYATGAVVGTSHVGGLVGSNEGTISGSYATGDLSGTSDVGLLVGKNDGEVSNSYYFGNTYKDDEADASTWLIYRDCMSENCPGEGFVSGRSGGNGLDFEGAKSRASYKGFDFDKVWFLYEGQTSPLLRSLLTPLNVSVNASGTKAYDGTTACTAGIECTVSYSGDSAKVFGLPSFMLSEKNVGARYAIGSGLYSDQQGYFIQYVRGETATITKAELTYRAQTAVKDVGAALDDLSGSVTGFVSGETFDSATLGNARWRTVATAPSVVGQYAVMGEGLTADNYSFVQAESNRSALTLKASASPEPVPQPTPDHALDAVPQITAGLLLDLRPLSVREAPGQTVGAHAPPSGVMTSVRGLGVQMPQADPFALPAPETAPEELAKSSH